MLLDLIGRGFSISEIYAMNIRMVMFLAVVNGRLKQFDTLQSIQSSIAANNRQLDDLGFSSLMNKLKFG